MRLFECEQYHARYRPDTARLDPKKPGRVVVDYGPGRARISDERTWRRHLEGSYCLSIAPNLSDGTASWGAIDVDDYQMDLAALTARVERLRISAIVVRTKSRGARVLVFFDGRVPIPEVVAALRGLCGALGLPDRETFPREQAEGGNPFVVNIPYPGYELEQLPPQVPIRHNGGEVPLAEFLRNAERDKMGQEQRARLALGAPPPVASGSRRRAARYEVQMPTDPEMLALWTEDLANWRPVAPDPDEDDHLLKMECALLAIPSSSLFYNSEGPHGVSWFKLACVLADNCPEDEGFAILMKWSEVAASIHHRDPDANLEAWGRACGRKRKATLNPATIYHFANKFDPEGDWRREYDRRRESGR